MYLKSISTKEGEEFRVADQSTTRKKEIKLNEHNQLSNDPLARNLLFTSGISSTQMTINERREKPVFL